MTTAVAVREKPILFSGPMVRAILDGRKKQTRRVMKPQPEDVIDRNRPLGYRLPGNVSIPINLVNVNDSVLVREHTLPQCPYGVPGDGLWVKTEHLRCKSSDGHCVNIWDEFTQQHRFSIGNGDGNRAARTLHVTREMLGPEWKRMPSMLMPRWASRLSLEITEVRVQRVQEISEDDALAEGVTLFEMSEHDLKNLLISDESPDVKKFWKAMGPGRTTALMEFRMLWDSINLKRGFGWDSNPWVWCVSFKRLA